MRTPALRPLLAALVAALVTGLLACADPQVVVHAGAPVVVSPAPDKPGFDPRSARLRASGREVERAAGHPIVLHVDAALLSNDPVSFEETLVQAVTALARVLARTQAEDPEAFALAAPKLREIVTKYEPLAPRGYPRARFEDGGKRLVVETSDRSGNLVPFDAILTAIRDAYDDVTEARFANGAPDARDRVAYFDWLTRTRPGRGSVVVHRAEARAKGSSESREAAGRDTAARIRLAVLELESRAEDPAFHARVEAWLVGELPRIEATRRDEKKLALLSRDDVLFQAERAYDRWVTRRLFGLPDKLALQLAAGIFPAGRPCGERDDGDAGCRARTPLPGVDRIALGMTLLEDFRRAGYDARRAEHPALVTKVVCPSQRDARGKTRESCNASFAANALSSSPGRARLLQAVIDARDPRFAAEIAATLHYAREADVRAYLRGLEPHHALYKETVRALVFGLWDGHRTLLEEESRRAWTRDTPDHRAAALTVLAESRGKLHRHYADGYFGRFAAEWGSLADAGAVGAMLADTPRAFASVPRLWLALEKSARVDPFLAGLDRLLAAPEDALEEPATTTLLALVARLCDDRAFTELERVRQALEAASRRSPDAARRLGNALDDATPKRCPTKDTAKEARGR